MPAEQRTMRFRDRRVNDPEYEALIQSTLARVSSGDFPSFRQAAAATGVSAQMKKSLR